MQMFKSPKESLGDLGALPAADLIAIIALLGSARFMLALAGLVLTLLAYFVKEHA